MGTPGEFVRRLRDGWGGDLDAMAERAQRMTENHGESWRSSIAMLDRFLANPDDDDLVEFATAWRERLAGLTAGPPPAEAAPPV